MALTGEQIKKYRSRHLGQLEIKAVWGLLIENSNETALNPAK